MLKSLFACGVLGVLLMPVQSQQISVCVEDDGDLRVDCQIEPKANKISSYEFSWSLGTKEALISTNVSGSASEAQFRDKSEVVELDPHGYRMTLKGFTETLPHNTTYMCKISGQVESINVERDHLAPCSAVSMFLKSPWSWITSLLLLVYHTHS
uniref:Ig-like domain-containing protein n=1 Tax=Nothobranchius pienaari TaxID=704102 RepID=A0A1A8MH60_9TELE